MNIQEVLESEKKYKNMYWKKHHECEGLKKQIVDFQRDLQVYQRKRYTGTIMWLSPHFDHGIISSEEFKTLFFHISQCSGFKLQSSTINKEVSFNVSINRGKFQAVNVSLSQDSMDYFDMLDHMETNEETTSSNVEEVIIEIEDNLEDDNLETIKQAKDIWYMNARGHSWDVWETLCDNQFVYTWNQTGKNDSLKDKLKINDIISWFMSGHGGYISILRVTGPITRMTDEELLAISFIWKDHMVEHDYHLLKIPVEFLSSVDKHNCVKKSDIPHWDSDWTSGLRGSYCMKPKNPLWKDQVIEMYKYMKSL